MTLMSTEVLPDARALRCGRRERALAQMAEHDLDVLVLGRQANVRYVTGAPQLWVAGTRPFAPICVLVRATGEIHLNSSWDEGIPEEIGRDHLYGLAWNPMTNIEVLKSIDGAATARRVGTDAMSPSFAQLLPLAFPNAELVNEGRRFHADLRIRNGRCYHGLALNIDMDLQAFNAIDPCGYPGLQVTQMRELGIAESIAGLSDKLIGNLQARLAAH